MAKKTYVSATALTLVYLPNGAHHYAYQGQPIPAGVEQSELDRLEAAGFIKSGPSEAVPEVDSTDISGGTKGAIPPKAGTKELWVEYAVENGWSREDAEAATRTDLIAALS